VVVTGLGVLAPTGLSVAEFGAALFAGKSGIGRISRFDTSHHSCKIAAELKGFDPTAYMGPKEAKRMDPFTQYAVVAAQAARDDAGLVMSDHAEETGVIFGSGIGGIQTFAAQHSVLLERGPRKVTPFFVPMMIADMSAGMISIMLGAKGPNYARPRS
jgi:3-oxoacyl-[acyl-carrier-protein] synthase II